MAGVTSKADGTYCRLHNTHLIVKNDEIPAAHVEAAQVVHRALGVVDVLVHHERRTPCVLPVSQPDLPMGTIDRSARARVLETQVASETNANVEC